MKNITITRRQVLRGAGGFTLGLPFLPSLVPGPAYAANVTFTAPRRFAAICLHHGGVIASSMYPAAGTLTNSMDLATGHTIHSGPLKRTVNGTDASLSAVMRAPASLLTDTIVSKMNVFRGLDYAYGGGHNSGAMLGNYAATDGNDMRNPVLVNRPTVDQVMAWSPSFYKGAAGAPAMRAMVGPSDDQSSGINGNSWTYSNSAAFTNSAVQSSVIRSGEIDDPLAMFKALFTGQMTPAAQRKPVVDHVIDDYRRLRQSNNRMTTDDKQRLDDHMSRLSELQRTLNAEAASIASCKDVKTPVLTMPKYQTFNDVFVAAFLCGASNIGVLGLDESVYATYTGSWHQDIAHKADPSLNVPAAQAGMVQANQGVFSQIFLDLATKMDVLEAPGQTLLDSSLVQMVNECGQWTHQPDEIPVITAGSAGGFLKTGLFCDYQNKTVTKLFYDSVHTTPGTPGISFNRYLATVMQAMGLQRTEYENPMGAGYGDPSISIYFQKPYISSVVSQNGDVLPFLKA